MCIWSPSIGVGEVTALRAADCVFINDFIISFLELNSFCRKNKNVLLKFQCFLPVVLYPLGFHKRFV